MTKMPPTRSNITLINAQLSDGGITSIRIAGPRIDALGAAPHPGDLIVDVEGDRVLPGLINAHDHLQLNTLTRPEFEKHYRHVREWISDVNAYRRSDPKFQAAIAVARDERLLIGGVKNLLSGVTTVAHHDPFYPFLSSLFFPTSVVRDYGWSHSLYVDGEEEVRSSYHATPADWPWIIHAGEGLDDEAGREFERLDALGCLGSNTLLVHGIALNHAQRLRLNLAAAGLIWCPSSNLHLFGRTADVAELVGLGRIALGTDSRLSGAGDLLDELRLANDLGVVDECSLESLVTTASARLLRLHDRGMLRAGARADILLLPARTRLAEASRADVRVVLIDGIARYGDRHRALPITPDAQWTDIWVDGRAKVLDSRIAGLVADAGIHESGLELTRFTGRAA